MMKTAAPKFRNDAEARIYCTKMMDGQKGDEFAKTHEWPEEYGLCVTGIPACDETFRCRGEETINIPLELRNPEWRRVKTEEDVVKVVDETPLEMKPITLGFVCYRIDPADPDWENQLELRKETLKNLEEAGKPVTVTFRVTADRRLSIVRLSWESV